MWELKPLWMNHGPVALSQIELNILTKRRKRFIASKFKSFTFQLSPKSAQLSCIQQKRLDLHMTSNESDNQMWMEVDDSEYVKIAINTLMRI